MKQITLTQGKVALVDDEDYESLIVYKWRAQKDRKNWYAVRTREGTDGKGSIMMHRQLLNLMDFNAIEVDHVDGDGLNNQRHNLRTSTKSQNHHNQRTRSDNTSKLKGVSPYKDRPGLWRARILINGKRVHIGCYKDPKEAALAYDEAARKHFGEFAKTNFSLGE